MTNARKAPDMANASWKCMSTSEGLGFWFTCSQTQPRRCAAWQVRAKGSTEVEASMDITRRGFTVSSWMGSGKLGVFWEKGG